MPIYSPGYFPHEEHWPCDAHFPLHSSLGKGPRGHSITVDVVQGDPYGYYRLAFKDEKDGHIISVTPNLDPGSRIYLCDQQFNISPDDVYSAAISSFTTEQLGIIRDARVGDLVLFKYKDEKLIDMFGIGIITSISNAGVVTFKSHINIGPGEIKESLTEYVNQQLSVLRGEINQYLAQMQQEDQAQINELVTEVQNMSDEVRDQLNSFVGGIFFGLTLDGHFIAYIPDSWNSVVFDTGMDYALDTYGRLILRMDVDGSGEVDQTPEIVRPYSDADLERKVYNIMRTLYEAGEPNGN